MQVINNTTETELTPPEQAKIEQKREIWRQVAKANNWHTTGGQFYVQIWATTDGEITDSVSYPGLDQDVLVYENSCECDWHWHCNGDNCHD